MNRWRRWLNRWGDGGSYNPYLGNSCLSLGKIFGQICRFFFIVRILLEVIICYCIFDTDSGEWLYFNHFHFLFMVVYLSWLKRSWKMGGKWVKECFNTKTSLPTILPCYTGKSTALVIHRFCNHELFDFIFNTEITYLSTFHFHCFFDKITK